MTKADKSNPLGLKILSKEEDLWTTVVNNIKNQIDAAEKDLKVNKSFLALSMLNLENAKRRK